MKSVWGGLYGKMLRNRATVEKVLRYRQEHPEEAQQLFERVNRFSDHRRKNRISVTSTAKKRPFLNALWKSLVMAIAFPYFVASALATSLVWIPNYFIKRELKDPAFGNTVTFGVRLLLFPPLVIAGTLVLCCTMPWYWAVCGSVLLVFSHNLFIDYRELSRRCISDFRWSFKKQLRKEYEDLQLNKLF